MELARLTRMNIPQTPRDVEEMNDGDFLDFVASSLATNPKNRSTKFFDKNYYLSFSEENKKRIRQIMAPGLMSDDSSIGVYVRSPQDYITFREWLGAIINDYHKTNIFETSHKSDWDRKGEEFDLARIHAALERVSMRIRCAAIPAGYSLPAEQTKEERLAFEGKMVSIFNQLGGDYYSLTPGHTNELTPEQYAKLVKDHYMFKAMTQDPHLRVSDLARDWPHGRGMFMKDIEGTEFKLIVWVGEEDLLRVMCMGYGSDMGQVFEELNAFRQTLISNGLELYQDPIIGNPTSCPSNIGTSMRMSILLETDNLVEGGISMDELKELAKKFGLQVRSLDGETGTSETLTYDISPSARYGITEVEMLRLFYEGLEDLIQAIKTAA